MTSTKALDELTHSEQILEVTRQRTNGLAKNLSSYYHLAFEARAENFENTLLPDWNNINSAELNFISSIKSFTDFLNDKDLADQRAGVFDNKKFIVQTASGERREFLDQTSVFANEKFPYAKGYGNDTTLFELLRRRPDPQVSAWVQRMEAAGKELAEGTVVDGETVTERDYADLWNWAAITGYEIMADMYAGKAAMEGDEEEDSDEDEDEDEEMADDRDKDPQPGAPMPLAHILSYTSNGFIPLNE
jgi:hypothetical protein